MLALMEVQRAEDIVDARNLIAGRASVISKIEKPSAVKSFDEILKVSDGVIVWDKTLALTYRLKKRRTV